MFKLIFALSGILLGLLLAYIAPEELKQGQKYFRILEKILFFGLVLTSLFFLWQESLILTISLLFIGVILFIVKLKFKTVFLEIPVYILFAVPYFLYNIPTFRLLIATLLFLYGFPLGLLLKINQ